MAGTPLASLFGDPHFGRVHRYDALAAFVRRLCVSPRRILDAGCGTGAFAARLRRLYACAEVYAVDIAPPGLLPAGIRFRQQDLQQPLPETWRDVDLITSIEMLEYAADDVAVLRNLRRVASSRATLVLCIMAKEGRSYHPAFGFRRFLPECLKTVKHASGQIRSGYTTKELEEKMEQAGWRIEAQAYIFGYVPMLAHTLFEVYRRWRFVPYLLTPPLRALCRPFAMRAGPNGGAVLTVGKAV